MVKSPQSVCRSTCGLMSSFLDHIRAKCPKVNPKPSIADAKTTFPLTGSNSQCAWKSSCVGPCPGASSWSTCWLSMSSLAIRAAQTAFTFSTTRRRRACASAGVSCSSPTSRSSLLSTWGIEPITPLDTETKALGRRIIASSHHHAREKKYQDGNNSLSPSLAQYRLGLNADPFDDVHNHNRAVTQPRRGGHVRAEVDVARTIDQVHQKHVGVIRRRPSRWCWGQGWRTRRPWRVHMALQRFSTLMLIPQTYRRGLWRRR
eukprot:scaffold7074_cov256-Pinguiococcus_pyrenoidosus.AAC.3